MSFILQIVNTHWCRDRCAWYSHQQAAFVCLHRTGMRWWAGRTSTWLTAWCQSKSPRTSALCATLPMTWALKSRLSASKPVRASLSLALENLYELIMLYIHGMEREPKSGFEIVIKHYFLIFSNMDWHLNSASLENSSVMLKDHSRVSSSFSPLNSNRYSNVTGLLQKVPNNIWLLVHWGSCSELKSKDLKKEEFSLLSHRLHQWFKTSKLQKKKKFKTYFAFEAVINDHHERVACSASRSESSNTFSHQIHHLLENCAAYFIYSECVQA